MGFSAVGMRCSLRSGFVVVCLVLALTGGRVSASAATTVDVDYSTTYQTMEGWGASCNFFTNRVVGLPEPTRSQMFDLIFDDLGFNILCIRLNSDFQISAGGAYRWNVLSDQRLILSQAYKRGQIDKAWVKVSSPPGYMKDSGDPRNGGQVLSQYYDDYAEYLKTYFQGMAQIYGYPLDALSMLNEPGFAASHETTTTTPAQYRDILKEVGALFDANGLSHIQMMCAETGHITSDVSGAYASTPANEPHYLNTLFNDSAARGYMDIISTHQYGDQLIVYGTGPPDDWTRLKGDAATHGKNVWETEMFIGGPGVATGDMAEGLRAALLAHTAVTQGNVTAWHYWQYANPEERDQNKAQGIVSIDKPDWETYTVYPLYYVLKHFGRNVPPGSVRVDAASSNADLRVSAFKREGAAVIIAFNQTGAGISATFNCTAINGNIGHIRTATGENYAAQPNIVPSANSFSATINGESISTFVVPLNVTAQTPTAMFSAFPRCGQAPLTVDFTDESEGLPTAWAWDFNNDGSTDSAAQNPQHVFRSPGAYSVKLTSTNSPGSGSETKQHHIIVLPPGGPVGPNGHLIANGDAENAGQPWDPVIWDPSTLWTGGAPTGVPLPGGDIVIDPTDSSNRVIELRGGGSHRIVGACARLNGVDPSGEPVSGIGTIRFRVYVPPGNTADFAPIFFDLDDDGDAHYNNELIGNVASNIAMGWSEIIFDPSEISKSFAVNDGECLLMFAFRLGDATQTIYMDDLEFANGVDPSTAVSADAWINLR